MRRAGKTGPQAALFSAWFLYAMLAGRPPFVGEPLSVLHQHVNEPPQPLRERRPDVPAALDAPTGFDKRLWQDVRRVLHA